MATNWYDPSGESAGFYNSPQDFLFKGGDNTWYGQGPAGQQTASQMPTASDYYFGAPQQPQAPTMPQVYGGPTRPEGYNAPGTQRGGGISIGFDNNAPVPVGAGPLWSRYQSVQANPAALTADPAYQFLQQQGEQAMGRTAGARRMRFAGKTMLDAQRFGQGLAAENFRTMLGELRAGAGEEYQRDLQNARAKATQASSQAFSMDPYGYARRAASFRSPEEYMASLGPRANYGGAAAEWQRGQEIKKLMGG